MSSWSALLCPGKKEDSKGYLKIFKDNFTFHFRVQLHFCERIDLYDDSKTVGINIILGAAEGEIVQVGHS